MDDIAQKSLLERLRAAGVVAGMSFNPAKGRFCDTALKREAVAWAAGRNAALADAKFAEVAYWLVHDLSAYPKSCATCGAPITHFHSFPLGYRRDHCSNRCAQLSARVQERKADTTEARLGVRHQMHSAAVKERLAATNSRLYGREHFFQAETFKERALVTIAARFDTDNVSKSDEIKARKIATSRRNHGVDHVTQSPAMKARSRATHIERYGFPNNNRAQAACTNMARYGFENVQQVPGIKARAATTWRANMLGERLHLLEDHDWLRAQIADRHIVDVATDLGVAFSTLYSHIHAIGMALPPRAQSRPEMRLQQFLADLGVAYTTADRRLIRPQEIDIVLPAQHVGIEVNGVYWHCEANKPGRFYHLDKTLAAEAVGYRLIHVFEDELQFSPDIVLSRIAGLAGCNEKIMARRCTVAEPSAADAKAFLDANHIQGGDASSVRLGLYREAALCALMTFVRSRFNKEFEWELSRYASACGTNVAGGGSRLFRHFVRRHAPASVITYADRRYSAGGLYEKMGFAFLHASPPSYFYVVNGRRQNRIAWQKHKLAAKLKTFVADMSEVENMRLNGYDRIWDCGTLAYGWHAAR